MPTCYRHPGRESYIRCQRCDQTICPDCMRDAAVGFHCPTCVAEGARQTRQARAPYGGTRSGNPALTSMVLIGLNAAVWLAIMVTGGQASRLVDRLALIPVGRCGAGEQLVYNDILNEGLCNRVRGGSWTPGIVDGAWWPLITAAFTHVEVWHIAFNMFALWFLGPQLEAAIGRLRFLALYLLSALTGSVAVLWLSAPNSGTVGASGAVFGLIGALLVLAIKVRGDVTQIGIWLLLNAVLTFTIPNISWQGHLGGFLGGVLIAAVIVYSPRHRRGTWQLGGLVLIGLLLLAAAAARVVTS